MIEVKLNLDLEVAEFDMRPYPDMSPAEVVFRILSEEFPNSNILVKRRKTRKTNG